ncbi:MAG: TonB-dependent receptor [Acidobacteria bacterium]|nr:TonB-dependent receptor [Acidobacteriota bacterium]
MRRFAGFTVLLVLLFAGGALAQTVSSTTGAIDGRVSDTSDAVLPGVTVSIASEAMMGTRDTVTNDTGTFRFVSITPGVYSVTFELPGFATVKRTGVRVGAGFTATLNISLQVAGLEEAVTVTGASPVVDTQATKISTSFDSKMLAQTPNGSNDPWAMLAETPAVKMNRIDVGGSAAGTQVGFTAYGTGGQRPYYEGINGTENTTGNGNYVDMNAYDEVAVNTVGNNAEMGPPGVMMVFVVKSGGNTYHGTGGFNYTDGKWQSYNIDAAQVDAGVTGGGGLEPRDTNRTSRFRDDYVQLGGYIVKDRLWWFGAVRDSKSEIRQTNFPVKPFVTTLRVYQGKGTYQLTQNNKFIGYYQWNTKDQPNRLDRFQINATNSIHLDDKSQYHQHYWPRISKVEYNSVLSDAMFFEVRAGQWGYDWTNTNELGVGTPSVEDTSSRIVSGASQHNYTNPRRNQVLGSLSYFREGMGGTHNLKAGWEIFRQTATTGQYDDSYNTVVHILRNGAPLEVFLLGYPQNATEGLLNTGLYLTDTWRANNKVTLNLGLRFDRYDNFLSEQSHEADRFFPETVVFPAQKHVRVWNTFAPRLGASYNVTGDGRTVIKGNWGIYWGNPGTGSSNPNGNWQKRHAWTDRNGNRLWEPGEEGRLISSSGGVATTSLDSGQQDPYTLDMSVWVERELVSNFGVRGGFVRRIEKQNTGNINTNQPSTAFTVPTTVRDPGPDGRIGTPDDGGTIDALNLQAAYVGLPTVTLVTNVPGQSEFDTIELAMNKRMNNHWSASASYSFTWAHAYRTASNTYPDNPNSCINASAKCQDDTTDYSFKLNGVFELPAGFKLSPVYRFQAGNNFARTFSATLNYANPTLLAEPMNSRRNDNINLIDLRVDRGFDVPGGRLSPFLDLYNLTNANAIQDITASSGSSFLRPINIIPPRVLRMGVKFDW